jgi:hypothetical protein
MLFEMWDIYELKRQVAKTPRKNRPRSTLRFRGEARSKSKNIFSAPFVLLRAFGGKIHNLGVLASWRFNQTTTQTKAHHV